MFLFHTGSIKSSAGRSVRSRSVSSFYSILVRLKDGTLHRT